MGLLGKRKAKDTPSKETPSSKKVKYSEADTSEGELIDAYMGLSS